MRSRSHIFKAFRSIQAIFFTLILVSCKEDPVIVQKKIFELEITPSYSTADRDNWVIISNSQGEPVTASSFESGQTLELTVDSRKISEVVTITFFSYIPIAYSASARDFYFFNSYTNITPGGKWFLKRSPSLPAETAGDITLNIVNLPDQSYDLSVSSFNRRNGITGTLGGTTVKLAVSLRESPSDLFISITGNNPRYKKIDAIISGQDISLDFTKDFMAYDHLYPVSFNSPFFLGTVKGFITSLDATQNTNTNYHEHSFYSGNTNQLQVGVNDGYPFYITDWSANFLDGSRVGYYKVGDAPSASSFHLQNVNFEILNSNLNGISFKADAGLTYCYNNWGSVDDFSQNAPVINWQTARPVTSQGAVLTKIPDEVLKAYPYLNILFSRLSYKNSTFVMNLNGTTYESYISDQWSTNSFAPKPREWYSITK